jgi:transposase
LRIAPNVTVTDEQRKTLERWSRGRSTPARLVLRARIVLQAVAGAANNVIAQTLGTDRLLVGKWRRRFVERGLEGMEKDAPRGGRPPVSRDAMTARIIEWTTQKKPKNATHWSCRTLAGELGASRAMVNRVWRANGLKPHLIHAFKLSNDKHFIEKVVDVVGLYLNPPEHALVLRVDEKTQIQALDRTQPSLPLKKGRCGTMTHDYKRNGTTTLFAALNVAEGKLIGACVKQHRHQEWIKFLKQIDRQTPADLDLHLIADNYCTHKHPKVKNWLKRHPRVHMHFIPTSSSWLNLVERWFREITDKRIRRGVFRSVPELTDAIMGYIQAHNQNPQSFEWTAKAEDIIEKVRRAREVLNKSATA